MATSALRWLTEPEVIERSRDGRWYGISAVPAHLRHLACGCGHEKGYGFCELRGPSGEHTNIWVHSDPECMKPKPAFLQLLVLECEACEEEYVAEFHPDRDYICPACRKANGW